MSYCLDSYAGSQEAVFRAFFVVEVAEMLHKPVKVDRVCANSV